CSSGVGSAVHLPPGRTTKRVAPCQGQKRNDGGPVTDAGTRSQGPRPGVSARICTRKVFNYESEIRPKLSSCLAEQSVSISVVLASNAWCVRLSVVRDYLQSGARTPLFSAPHAAAGYRTAPDDQT